MEYSLFVDQLALKRWHGKIDGDDALILAFIAKLNPHNEAVRSKMRRGYFRFSRLWVLTEVPLLTFHEEAFSRRLRKLRDIGIIDIDNTPEDGHFSLYVRLSKLYFQELEKAKAYLDRMTATKTSSAETSSTNLTTTSGANVDDAKVVRSLKEIQESTEEKEVSPPPGRGGPAVGSTQEEDPLANDPLLATCKVCGSIYQRARPGGCNYCEDHKIAGVPA